MAVRELRSVGGSRARLVGEPRSKGCPGRCGGQWAQLTKLRQRALKCELTDHLGHEPNDMKPLASALVSRAMVARCWIHRRAGDLSLHGV